MYITRHVRVQRTSNTVDTAHARSTCLPIFQRLRRRKDGLGSACDHSILRIAQALTFSISLKYLTLSAAARSRYGFLSASVMDCH